MSKRKRTPEKSLYVGVEEAAIEQFHDATFGVGAYTLSQADLARALKLASKAKVPVVQITCLCESKETQDHIADLFSKEGFHSVVCNEI